MTIKDANANTPFRSRAKVPVVVKEAGFVDVYGTKEK